MSDIAVFGAGGRVGQLLVPALAEAGHTVSAVVRSPAKCLSKFPEWGAASAIKVVAGDVCTFASVKSVLSGQDACISVVGPPGRKSDSLYSQSARTLVAALHGLKGSRLMVLSSAGVLRDDPEFPLWYKITARTLLRELYGDMTSMENTLHRSSLDWTIVRPGRITTELATGKYRVSDEAIPPGGSTIPAADLVKFMVEAIGTDRWSRATPTPTT